MTNKAFSTNALASEFPDQFLISPIRADHLGDLRADGVISDAQLLAGRKWQALFLRLEFAAWRGAGVRRFQKKIGKLSRVICPAGEWLLYDVLHVGLSFRDAARKRGDSNRAAIKGWAAIFNCCLNKLALLGP